MLFNAEPLAQCGYGTAVSWAPPSAHITEPPAELLVSVCMKTQAPSIVAKGVLKVKDQRCPPPHYHGSCRATLHSVLWAWRVEAL